MWILIDDLRNGDYDIVCRNGEAGVKVFAALTANKVKIVGLKNIGALLKANSFISTAGGRVWKRR
jgi:hypothetical protein